MPNMLKQKIIGLNDVEALIAARSLIVLLDIKLKETQNTSRPSNAVASEPNQLIEQADPETRNLSNALQRSDQSEAAASARVLILACLEMGYEEEVATAYESTKTHVLDMGLLSGPILVAALAAVVAWVPVQTKRKVTEKTTVDADGSITTIKEIEEEVSREGAEGIKALKGWWSVAFGA